MRLDRRSFIKLVTVVPLVGWLSSKLTLGVNNKFSGGGVGFYKEASYENFTNSIVPAFGITSAIQKYYRITGVIVVQSVTGVASIQAQVGWTETNTGLSYTDTLTLLRSDGTTASQAGLVANYTFTWFGFTKQGTGISLSTLVSGTVTYDLGVIMEGFIT